MIDQIAMHPSVDSTQLILHAQTIKQTLREKSEDSRNLSSLSRETKNVAQQLLQAAKNLKREGVRVIVCESLDNAELDVNKVVKMLKESSDSLGKIANKFDKHARGYDYQIQVNDHTMNTFQSVFSLRTRVATCERQANARLVKQRDSLQRALPKIEDHEMTVVGMKGIIGLPVDSMPLLDATRRVLNNM